ncbi:flagellin [Exiguobacterium profundum]|uniref:flagellin N-terminal helical domain-containing protein n=1 Tax=Exiguobacterium profundum TaxID=307643 RepID=UPI00339429C5
MIINHNLNAMNANRNMGFNTTQTGKAMEKLSSGLRINRAGDDAAGLAISEKMRGQIRGLDQASRNAQDGISLIQTAEGALNETHSILQRMRELGVQSANDTNTDADRYEVQKEINQLTSEINRIGNSTEFNTKKVINGDLESLAGGGAQETVQIDFSALTAEDGNGSVQLSIGGSDYTVTFNATMANTDAPSVSGTTITIGTNGGAASVGSIESALKQMRGNDPSLSLKEFDISQSGSTLTIATRAAGNLAGKDGEDSIRLVSGLDASAYTKTTEGADGSNGAIKVQVGANKDQLFTLEINDMRSLALGIAGTTAGAPASSGASFVSSTTTINGTTSNNGLAEDNSGATEFALDVSDSTKATAAVSVLDSAIAKVSAERSKLGAAQNRLEHTINNLGTSAENLQAAESRIRDVDMAKEMMNFTKNNILNQAAQAMLAQAKSQPEAVLQLLR